MSSGAQSGLILPQWHEQRGGLHLAIQPYDKTNAEDREAAEKIIVDGVQNLASVHGAQFSKAGLRNNMRALDNGRMKLRLLKATWKAANGEVCGGPSDIFTIGAILGWQTVGMGQGGKFLSAEYIEDFCLPRSRLRPLVAAGKPLVGKSFPKESLAECFQRLLLEQLVMDGNAFQLGEVDPKNTKITRALAETGAVFETGPDSAVIEFKRLPYLFDRLPMPVEKIDLAFNGVINPNKFVLRWWQMTESGLQKVDFIVTRGQATVLGEARMDIQPEITDNPAQGVLECVFASMLLAAEREAEDRHWKEPEGRIIGRSPSIPLLGSRQEMVAATFDGCGDELLIPEFGSSLPFGEPVSDAHVYVRNDERALKGLYAIGGQPRIFGDKIMIPGVTDLTKMTLQNASITEVSTVADNDNISLRPANEARGQPGELIAA